MTAKAPVLGAEQAANRVLKKAVESIQFLETYKPRGTPDGNQSDRMHQADRDSKSHGVLGTTLDVMA